MNCYNVMFANKKTLHSDTILGKLKLLLVLAHAACELKIFIKNVISLSMIYLYLFGMFKSILTIQF